MKAVNAQRFNVIRIASVVRRRLAEALKKRGLPADAVILVFVDDWLFVGNDEGHLFCQGTEIHYSLMQSYGAHHWWYEIAELPVPMDLNQLLSHLRQLLMVHNNVAPNVYTEG